MKALVLSLVAVVTFYGCDKSVVQLGTPSCIKQLIWANKINPNWRVEKVEEYEFQGKLVYAFQPDHKRIADGATRIVSADCKQLCYVGGFGGPDITLCNGVNFYQNAVLKREIWSKY
ncbi:MAG TPA: hypothetical protein VF622_12085 [Segetibacter sp.]|jgi:hypothetical protein